MSFKDRLKPNGDIEDNWHSDRDQENICHNINDTLKNKNVVLKLGLHFSIY